MRMRLFGLSLKPKGADKLVPLFGGFCFFLSAIEFMIPKPVPFFRIGLANLPILLGIDFFSFPAFCFLLLIKVLGQALVSGTLFSYISVFSLSGTFAAGLTMYAMHGIPRKAISFIGISIAGAFVSNLIQILLAVFFIFGKSALYIVPPVFFAGTVTAFFLGLFAYEFSLNSTWYENVVTGKFTFDDDYNLENKKNRNNKTLLGIKENYLRCGSGIVLLLLLLFIEVQTVKAVLLGASLILCVADKQRVNFLNLIIMFVAVVLFNLFPPAGKIIFAIDGFIVTSDALLRGIEKAVILEGMLYISKWTLNAEFNFKSNFGKKIALSIKVFRRLTAFSGEINPKKIIPTIDSILLSI